MWATTANKFDWGLAGLVRTLLVVSVAAIGLSACQSIPTSELTAYRAAFGEANAAKDQVLIDFTAAKAAADEFLKLHTKVEGEKNTSPFPSSLDEGVAGPDPVATRHAAWQVIVRYNAALTDLAEGKSDDEAKAAVGGLGTAIGRFAEAATGSAIPGIGSLVEIAQVAAGEIEKARRTKEFKRAVRVGAPLVNKILDAMQDDAKDLYEIRQALIRQKFVDQTAALTESIGGLFRLLAEHAPSEDGDYLETINERLNGATLPLADQLQEFPYTLAWAEQGGEAFSETARSAVDLRLAEIEQRAAAMVALIQEANGIHDTLNAYRTLIGKTKTALVKLDQALDAPVDVATEAEEILDTVFLIKQGIEKYRLAREQAKAAAVPAVMSTQ